MKTPKNPCLRKQGIQLEKSGFVLCSYTGKEVKNERVCTVNVDYEGGKYFLDPAIVSCKWRRPSSVKKELSGRN